MEVHEYLASKFNDAWNHAWGYLGATGVVAIPATIFGVDSHIIYVLFGLYILDFITGIIRTISIGETVSSRRAFDGVLKGILYITFILASYFMTIVFSDYAPIHIWAIIFTCSIEFKSILENIKEAKITLPIIDPVLDFVGAIIEKLIQQMKK